MPLWAWVVTARMSNILNFSWYFLCIPAIYRCILAYLPIFFNQLSKFLRCESPSTFLGTCLSHHYFIIFLVTNTNTLLSGLYLISTVNQIEDRILLELVSMPSRAYTSFLRMILLTLSLMIRTCQCPLGLIPHFYSSIARTPILTSLLCQCPLGLIPHFYVGADALRVEAETVSMPSRAYTSFLPDDLCPDRWPVLTVSMPSRAYTSFLPFIRLFPKTAPISSVNALSGLYLISTVPLQKPRFYAVSIACFCRYLSEYSDNSRFSCMLTFWTYLLRCTYPWHWIKYSTNYNRCHPIFSLSW